MILTMARTTTNAKGIAGYFIWKAQREGEAITNKKLQKLLYYAHRGLAGPPFALPLPMHFCFGGGMH